MADKWLKVAVALVASAALVAGCGGSSSGGGDGSGGVIKTATVAEVKSMDPVDLSIYFTSGGDRAAAIYGTLMKYGENGEAVPAMAKSFESPDGKVWTLTLRDGVTFTDGTAFDAEAVKFNIERHVAPDSVSLGKSLLAGLEKVEVVDPLTVTFTLKEKNGSFPALFTQGSNLGFIASPTAIKKDPKGFGLEPVGAGPFVMKEFARDDHMTVTRNPDYWDADNVAVDEIDYAIIADPQTQAQSLLSGTLNMSSTLMASAWSLLKDNDGFTIYADGTLGANSFFPNTQRGPGKDLAIRQAMQEAFDPAASNEVLARGALDWDGDRNCLPFTADSDYCAEGSYPEYDLTAAKQAVADYVAAGNSNALDLLCSDSQLPDARYVQQVLNSIGLDVKIHSVDRASFSGLAYEGNYDAVVAMRLPFANPYPSFFNLFSSTGTNYPKADDPALETLLDDARNADGAAAPKAWSAALAHINEQALAIWMAPAGAVMASATNVHLGNDFVAGGSVWYPADVRID